LEAQADDALASILLVDVGHLRHGGAPADAINGTVIGTIGGLLLAFQEPIRYLALPHSLSACWSTPVFSSQGEVIATFAMYYREPRRPTQRDQEVIDQITHLAGAAIQQKLAEEKLQRSEAYLAQAQKLTHTGSWAWDPRTENMLYCSEEMFRIFGLDPLENLPTRKTFRQRIHPEDRYRVAKSF
jgi:PAS domain-containing protein